MPHPPIHKQKCPPTPVPAGATWITGGQVRARYGGKSNTWLDEKVKTEPAFPRPHYFGTRLRHFNLAKLEEYERSCVAEEYERSCVAEEA
jgi:hypothetical protein